jgi:hypothetical protein
MWVEMLSRRQITSDHRHDLEAEDAVRRVELNERGKIIVGSTKLSVLLLVFLWSSKHDIRARHCA